MKRFRVFFGIAIWAALLAGLGYGWRQAATVDSPPKWTADLVRYAVSQRREVSLEASESCYLKAGDPIFVIEGEDQVRRIGEISRADSDRLEALFYASAPPLDDSHWLSHHRTPDSLEWVLKTMLPPHKRKQMTEELQAAAKAHHEEILRTLRPVVEDGLKEALAVVEQDLPKVLKKHQPELEELGGKYQRDIVEREIVPLVKNEIWPIVRRQAEPTVTQVGKEIWQRASLWRFGWRYFYDKTPLPQRDLTRREWERFLREEATPVLESHTGDFIEVQKRILKELVKNDKVRKAARKNLGRIMDDPQMQKLVWTIVREGVVENPRLKQTLDKHWQSPRTQRAMQLAGQRLEPLAVRMGELLVGTPETGVTEEFARVLRNQILRKDRRWLVLQKAEQAREGKKMPVEPGDPDAINPFVRDIKLQASSS